MIRRSCELTAVSDDNSFSRPVAIVARVALDCIKDISAVGDLSKDAVITVQMRSVDEAEEELGAVRVGASVGHRQDASARVLVDEVLVSEVGSVDGLAASAVSASEVTTLGHEVPDDAMEAASLEVKWLSGLTHASLSCAELAEVLRGLWSVISERHSDSASSLTTDGDVKEDLSVWTSL